MSRTDSMHFSTKKSPFYSEVKRRVDAYFKEGGISKRANTNMYIKTVFMFAAYLSCYFLITLHVSDNKLIWLLLSAGMGLSLAGIGLCVMHDANHGSFSEHKILSPVLSFLSLSLIGGHALNWRIQHNNIHHNYTNVHEHDEDITPPGVLRFEPHAKIRWIHRFQFVYAWLFYGMMTLTWCTIKDFTRVIRYHKNNMLGGKTSLGKELTIIIFSKIVYFSYMLLPYFIIKEMTFLNWLSGFLVMHYIGGLGLAAIFQAAHVVEETHFPLPDQDGNLNDHWAEHQLKTTMNFATGDRVFSWFIGGLNYQVEHHLFPTICHVHYHKISEIVKSTAHEFDLPYHSKKTFFEAIRSHERMLYKLGRNQDQTNR